MEKVQTEGAIYARIEGVGLVKCAAESERMTLNQKINAKSWQAGLMTRYTKSRNGISVPVHMKCFISLCHVRIADYKEAPNFSGWQQPSAF
jgi:hypothetical protein